MRPRERVRAGGEALDRADVDALAAMDAEDATNHQVAESPVVGREAIRAMFRAGLASAETVCIPESLFEDGDWAILEWRDPQGLRGCGYFRVVDGRIAFQRECPGRTVLLALATTSAAAVATDRAARSLKVAVAASPRRP